MRPVKWEDCIKALALIMESPNTEKGYEDLKKYFYSNNLKKESDAVDFLIKEKFNVHGSNIDKE